MKIKIKNDNKFHEKNEKIKITNQNCLAKERNDENFIKNDEKKECLNDIKYLKQVIERSILSHHNYKVMDILTSNDINMSVQYMEKIYKNFYDFMMMEHKHKDMENFRDFLKLFLLFVDVSTPIMPLTRRDRKSTCLNSSHVSESRMPSSA